jgi:hypothetical protein
MKRGLSHQETNMDYGDFVNRVLRKIFGPKRIDVTGR